MKKKVLIQNPSQNPNDTETLRGKALNEFDKQREENLLSVETKLSQVTRWGIAALGVAICVLIVFLSVMYCVFIFRLTIHFFHNIPMLIDFLIETWRTITSASAAAVPFLVYLMRKETKDR